MAKNTVKKSNDINTALVDELIAIRNERKELSKKFKIELQAIWDKYRLDKKALRERKAAAWKKYSDAKNAAKNVAKSATKTPAKKAPKAKNKAAK